MKFKWCRSKVWINLYLIILGYIGLATVSLPGLRRNGLNSKSLWSVPTQLQATFIYAVSFFPTELYSVLYFQGLGYFLFLCLIANSWPMVGGVVRQRKKLLSIPIIIIWRLINIILSFSLQLTSVHFLMISTLRRDLLFLPYWLWSNISVQMIIVST